MARRRADHGQMKVRLLAQDWIQRCLSAFGAATGALRAHPRWASSAAGLIVLGAVLALFDADTGQDSNRISQSVLQIPDRDSSQPAPDISGDEDRLISATDSTPEAQVDPSTQPVSSERDWQFVEVQSGQTLERIFRDLGLSARELHELVHLDEHTRQLADIRPGDQFGFEFDEDNRLLALRADFDEQRWLIVEREESGLASRFQDRAMDSRVVEASGIISSSLFNAAKDAGLSDSMTMRLASIFGWDIDFALDIRSGDRFALIYEEIWRDGEFLRDGPILAARFVNQGDAFEAIRFDAGNGPDYFAPDGRPMRKAFLRAPLNFSYVTSNFNPRRFHPVTRRIAPHRGTDYAAPVGTPIWAAGDGRVTKSAYDSLNGHHVFIQHGNNIVTKYLHLSRRQVARGDRVRQGQTIGRLGATGRVTGAHLHYEFLVNGVHRNPRTVDLPPADPLPPDLMDSFRLAGEPLLAKLLELQGPEVLLAQREANTCEQSDTDC
ncbi:MAG: peptidoglycan DD-metalloendopeptidase family protein [Wenzhouxiangella sp.]|nr:peptidoglycan DD-metalloendopeptidase family protein [Wenzhouxiangella sp.]